MEEKTIEFELTYSFGGFRTKEGVSLCRPALHEMFPRRNVYDAAKAVLKVSNVYIKGSVKLKLAWGEGGYTWHNTLANGNNVYLSSAQDNIIKTNFGKLDKIYISFKRVTDHAH